MMQIWDPGQWKRRSRILSGLATIWPHVYLLFFIIIVTLITFSTGSTSDRKPGSCGTIDPQRLEEKIKQGDIQELFFTPGEVVTRNRTGTCEYRTPLRDEELRQRLLQLAQEPDATGKQRVAKINQNQERSVSPAALSGFIVVMVLHFITILWVIALVIFYSLMAVKNAQIDQGMKIIWVLGFCMVTMITLPVYWFIYVWRKPQVAGGDGASREILATS